MSCAVCKFSPTSVGITNVASWAGSGAGTSDEDVGEETAGLEVGICVTITVSVTVGAGVAHELRSTPVSDVTIRLVATLIATLGNTDR